MDQMKSEQQLGTLESPLVTCLLTSFSPPLSSFLQLFVKTKQCNLGHLVLVKNILEACFTGRLWCIVGTSCGIVERVPASQPAFPFRMRCPRVWGNGL